MGKKLTKYELNIVLKLDESFPENDYEVLRKRIFDIFRDECIQFESKTFRLREVVAP